MPFCNLVWNIFFFFVPSVMTLDKPKRKGVLGERGIGLFYLTMTLKPHLLPSSESYRISLMTLKRGKSSVLLPNKHKCFLIYTSEKNLFLFRAFSNLLPFSEALPLPGLSLDPCNHLPPYQPTQGTVSKNTVPFWPLVGL